MPLRQRLAWVAASAVALAVILASIACYMAVRRELLGQVDSQLQQQAEDITQLPSCNVSPPTPPASAGGGAPIWQFTTSEGICGGNVQLPTDTRVQAIANGETNGASHFSTITVGGAPFRELIQPVVLLRGDLAPAQLAALQLARPLGPIQHVLGVLRLVLLLVCAGGVALAAVLGRLAARRVLAPLAEVAQTAQHIEETEDLSSRIRVHADDEVGQLATRFNAMIERLQHSREALDESVRAQRQLVADASHELRTPITSLRTNIEVLLEQGDALTDEDRRRLLADVLEQSEELSALIGDVIELARGDLPITTAEDIHLDRVVAESVARAKRAFPHVNFEATLDPVVVEGVPERLARAVNNLLDNAAHHSPSGGLVEVVVDSRGVRVRDHGTGIDKADLPYVFDRFFRGANSRHRQGSGLGLAIVRQVAVQHGGSVEAGNAPGGGAIFTLRLPTTAADPLARDAPYPEAIIR
ncbi:MAG: HAMP domain-containing histidine kinase [Solirubrobacterales bacterium]|nr:HAMP domain-containing histidine kinase [Solirubrobacterales bacterium]MBV9365158.1 HAMP domain-containing histidine kinase [Solirubrobacterales bacterium]MBV9682357.1 HAMP domain-containing histidine kinase [Solirubrobacterales bacterium]MBV9808151.1 HAMP domain-containing histidine kinase [Solirubrobacterales bacterium]